MSETYNQYLSQHKTYVRMAFDWIRYTVPELLKGIDETCMLNRLSEHDSSKNMSDEYPAYDAYFYGGNRSAKVVHEFELAFLKHLHRNPHHWQYWVLMDDGKDEHTEKVFEMPYEDVLEMVCDWWSFSWSKGDHFTIFAWYEEHKDGIKLHPKTKKAVENILETLKRELEKTLDK